MAIVSPTVVDTSGDGSTYLISWNLTTADHTGASIDASTYADRTAFFESVAWGASTAAVEGANVLTGAYLGLADVQGTAISKTANAVESIVELTRYIRPRLTTTGTAAAVTVSMMVRRATPLRT